MLCQPKENPICIKLCQRDVYAFGLHCWALLTLSAGNNFPVSINALAPFSTNNSPHVGWRYAKSPNHRKQANTQHLPASWIWYRTLSANRTLAIGPRLDSGSVGLPSTYFCGGATRSWVTFRRWPRQTATVIRGCHQVVLFFVLPRLARRPFAQIRHTRILAHSIAQSHNSIGQSWKTHHQQCSPQRNQCCCRRIRTQGLFRRAPWPNLIRECDRLDVTPQINVKLSSVNTYR